MDKPRARFPEPKIPHIKDRPVLDAVSELRKTGAALQSVDVVQGHLTDDVTLGVLGTTHRIPHGLSYTPRGFELARYEGFPPKYRIESMDARHVTIVSLDQVDVCGSFDLDGAGAVTTGAKYLWTASKPGVGIYRIVLSFACSALLSAEMKSTTLSGATEVRYTSSVFTGPDYVNFTNFSLGVATDLVSLSCLFHIAVTGTEPRCKWWVY